MAYRGRFFIRKRIWRCGQYAEAEYYTVFQQPGKRRSKCRPTRECQQLINQRDSARKLKRIVQANFGENDLEIDLTYARPESIEGAVKDAQKYLRRIRKIYRDSGEEMRYVLVWERGVKSGRVHFHLIMNAGQLSRDRLEELWQHGHANSRRLRMDENGLAALIEYVTKKSRKGQRRPGERRWTCSKNLVRPEPEIRDGAVSVGEVMELAEDIDRRSAGAVIPGMTLVEAEAFRNRVNRGLYVRFEMAAAETWHGRRPVARYFSGELGGDPDEPM